MIRSFQLSKDTTIETNIDGFDPVTILERMRALPFDLAQRVLDGELEVEQAEGKARERQ